MALETTQESRILEMRPYEQGRMAGGKKIRDESIAFDIGELTAI
jgi:hypothetical protein